MKGLHAISFILVVIGALNWGLVGLGELINGTMDWNLVTILLGSWPVVEALVYILVGLGAIVLLVTHKRDCRHCSSSSEMSAAAM